ncbi:porin family protein [Aegicerativicinus sediminis]|uniref:porin family protein n=1 Tax=Aegicerativicinus sediminis TaxID=2893202 RepID=UPI001E4752C3|nr:porin family protein [Aegicerativicinus sediminis]
MRTLFLGFSFFLLVIINTTAQSKGDISIAPQLGINLTNYFSTDYSYDLRVAPSVGVIGDYFFSNRWSLRSGLIYDQMGAKDDLDYTDKLSYLSLPVNANWHFGSNRKWYLNFGPSISFLLNAKSEFEGEEDIDIGNYIPGVDVGLAFGIGYIFNVNNNTQIFIDYQGYAGFIDLDKLNLLDNRITNSKSSFNIGARFFL